MRIICYDDYTERARAAADFAAALAARAADTLLVRPPESSEALPTPSPRLP